MTTRLLSYELAADGSAIKCLRCGMTSHNPYDVRERYCGRCRAFHEDQALAVLEEFVARGAAAQEAVNEMTKTDEELYPMLRKLAAGEGYAADIAKLVAEAKEALDELEDYVTIARLQRKREQPWIERWRKETGKPNTLPDYGDFLGWLLDKLDRVIPVPIVTAPEVACFRLRCEAVGEEMHVWFYARRGELFFNLGELEMDLGEWQLFGAALLIGTERTDGRARLIVEGEREAIDAITAAEKR